MIQEPLSIAALIAGVTALTFWLDHRFEPLSKIGAPDAVTTAIWMGITLAATAPVWLMRIRASLAAIGMGVMYTLVVVGIHGIFLLSVGRVVLKGSAPMLAVVTQASVGGPSTAMAVAVSRDWPALVLPGVAYLVRAIIGG